MDAKKPQLRTKSGCNSCRRRKKKCDERKPICTRCSIASVACVWPTAQQLCHDRRLRTSQTAFAYRDTTSFTRRMKKRIVNVLVEPPRMLFMGPSDFNDAYAPVQSTQYGAPSSDVVEMTIAPYVPFNAADDSVLFSYYLSQLLPSTIHKKYRLNSSAFSYWSSMAMTHPPLMDIALACAGISISQKAPSTNLSKRLRKKALIHQTSAVTSIRGFINSGAATGGEDWLLAAVESMVLFTYRDPDAALAYASPHINALAEIFKCREAARQIDGTWEPIKHRNTASRVTLFERICYESLLYYSTIFMWFDDSLDALADEQIWGMMDRYFRDSLPPEEFDGADWPILGVPHTLFKLIMDVSKLYRQPTLGESDLKLAAALSSELASWRELADTRQEYSVATLYVHVTDVLLQQVLSRQPPNSATLLETLPEKIGQCIEVLALTEIGPHFSSYQLWPISVLGCVATEDNQRQLVARKLAAIFQNMDCVNITHSDSHQDGQ